MRTPILQNLIKKQYNLTISKTILIDECTSVGSSLLDYFFRNKENFPIVKLNHFIEFSNDKKDKYQNINFNSLSKKIKEHIFKFNELNEKFKFRNKYRRIKKVYSSFTIENGKFTTKVVLMSGTSRIIRLIICYSKIHNLFGENSKS